MLPLTASGCQRPQANRASPWSALRAVVALQALYRHYFLLAWRLEIAPLPPRRWIRLAGVLFERMSHPGSKTAQIHTLISCSTLVPARLASRRISILAKRRRFDLAGCAAGVPLPPQPSPLPSPARSLRDSFTSHTRPALAEPSIACTW